MPCEYIGVFEPENKEDLIACGIRELEKQKLQEKKIEFRDCKTKELLLLSPWTRKNCFSNDTVYGIELTGGWYCPEYRNDPDDRYDCWNDQWYGSRIQMLFEHDPSSLNSRPGTEKGFF